MPIWFIYKVMFNAGFVVFQCDVSPVGFQYIYHIAYLKTQICKHIVNKMQMLRR